ncbi:efflux RND transporter periplasmic adaptor subunit [Rhodopirellula bahusiensis]|uniref:efflux RND transporter periplasmic adaptor subunit n=1 Tax=Rhodopirellula bahusiensis TaxID=2014065 RepID=UPI0032974B90
MTLRQSSPSYQHHTTASVAPWKAERIAFEQAGRVVQVIEPNEMVTGIGNGRVGVPLARLNDEQFQIAVDAAEADAAVAQRRRDANLIAIERRLPSRIRTAEAELQLAERELARAQKLSRSNAMSGSELDTTRTRASTAQLQVDGATAELAQADAEQLALDAQVQQANQRLAEAKRNLRNTTLYSSFPGQVAEVHAVPGTYVKEGDPIVTVQMVDPMMVEFEVTAANSRRYQRGDTLGVTVTRRDGVQRQVTGMVYTVDSIADANTRTFTVSLHVRNQQESSVELSESNASKLKTKDIFPLNIGPIVTGDRRLLVEQRCIHRIGDEAFVWKVTNRAWSQLSDTMNRDLNVQRLKVNLLSDVIPFLGTWNFVAIEFADPSAIDLEDDLITSQLLTLDGNQIRPEVLSRWESGSVVLEQTRWMLRSGDTVRVALIPDNSNVGFYVPMKAVRKEDGANFVHVLDDTQAEPTAKRVQVRVTAEDTVADDSLILCIEPVQADELVDGSNVVVRGTHYVDDGDRVRGVPTPQASAVTQ